MTHGLFEKASVFLSASTFVPCWWWSYVFGLQVNRYNWRVVKSIPFEFRSTVRHARDHCLSFTWNFPQKKCPQFVFYRWQCGSLLLSLRWEKLNEGQRRGLGPIPPMIRSLSLHRVLMRWGVPVWVAGHVAVGRHVHSLGRRGHVPYGRDGRRARGQSDGARQRVTLMGITALLQQLLKLRPFVLEPDFYLKYKANKHRH